MMSSSQVQFSDYDTVVLAGTSGLELSEFNTPASKLVIFEPDPERRQELEALYSGNSAVRLHVRGLSGNPAKQVFRRYNLSRLNGICEAAAARDFFPNLRETDQFPVEQRELNAAIAEANLKRGEKNLVVIGANSGASDILDALAESSAARRVSDIQVFVAEEALFQGDVIQDELEKWTQRAGFDLTGGEVQGRDPYRAVHLKRVREAAKPAATGKPKTAPAKPEPAAPMEARPASKDKPAAPAVTAPLVPAHEVELRRALLGLEEKTAELELAKATSKLQAEEQRLSAEKLTDELKQAQALLAEAKKEKAQANRLAGAAKSRAKTTKTKLQKALDALKAETRARERAEADFEQLQQAHDDLLQQVEEANTARETLSNELEAARQDVLRLTEAQDDQQASIEALEQANAALQDERDALQTDCETLNAKEAEAAARQAELVQEAEAAQSAQRDQDDKLQDLQQQLSEAVKQAEDLSGQLSSALRDRDDERDNVAKLTQELETARDNLSLAVRMQSMLEANQKDLQQKYSALAEEKHEADALIAAFMQRLEQASAAQANLPGRDENFAEFTEVTDDNSAVESR